ncbi:MAG: hypothetical protein H7Z11_03335 [Verrucomicrobia bacterium]|nr:hypothetical protein [Leptolyngbya sp. ES-bin-22]
MPFVPTNCVHNAHSKEPFGLGRETRSKSDDGTDWMLAPDAQLLDAGFHAESCMRWKIVR